MDVTLTPGLEDLQQGQSSLREQWSIVGITFRGDSVTALIDRNPTMTWADGDRRNGKANVQFLPTGHTLVTLFKDDISSDPSVGECFVEGTSKRHRIQELREYDLHWLCLCKTGAAT